MTYSAKNPQEATLGAIGVARGGEFESKMLPNIKGLPVRVAANFSSSTSADSQTQFSAAAEYAAAAGHANADLVKQSLRSGNFQILKIAS